MNEAEWLACTNIYNVLEYLRGKVSDRKLRLLAVACCQRPYYQVAVEALVHTDMATAAGWAVLEDAWETAYQVTGVEREEKHADEANHQLALLRDIFGNHFRPITLDSGWLGPKVVDIAQAIYDDRAFDRLPELADALEHAGCTNAEILAHCRARGPHVRGCWAVDLVLGRA